MAIEVTYKIGERESPFGKIAIVSKRVYRGELDLGSITNSKEENIISIRWI